MEKMKSDIIFIGEFANILLDGFFGAFEIVIVEIKSDKNISLMKLLDDTYCVTSESEGTINHDISLCRA